VYGADQLEGGLRRRWLHNNSLYKYW